MKNYSLKCSLLLLTLMLYFLPAPAQEADPEWTFLKEMDGVGIYYASSACGQEDYLTLKLENSNASAATIHLMLEVEEGENRMHYPMLLTRVEAGQAEVLDCQNLGMTGEFTPFPVQQISQIAITVQDFLIAKN